MKSITRLPSPLAKALSLAFPAIGSRLADAQKTLGNNFLAQGKLNEAKACYLQALSYRPSFAEALNNLGIVHKAQGDLNAAATCLRRAIELNPELANSYFVLGQVLASEGKLDDARGHYETAVRLTPSFTEARFELAMLLLKSANPAGAESQLRTACELAPDSPPAYIGLAEALRSQGKLAEARNACLEALRLDPQSTAAHCHHGRILQEEGHLDEACASYEKALSIAPTYAPAEFSLALALLMQGDLIRGFRHIESRWRANNVQQPVFRQPQWSGECLTGKRIFVYFEYGFGDTLQFVRYVPELARMGAEVVLGCQQPLTELMKTVEGVAQVVTTNGLSDIMEAGKRQVDFDFHAPLWSLPYVFGTSLQTIPARVPYISCDPKKLGFWGSRMGADNRLVKVGLVWKGNRDNLNDKTRSMALAQFAPLLHSPGFVFYSLQKDTGEESSAFGLIDHTSDLSDFSDTVALCQNLDLIISVDTAVAHLAGALGKPVWLLNRFESEWRWLLGREDSPWYPTMKIIRQESRGDWASVIRMVEEKLSTVARS
jgi:tetratricopeptide (TPR) repeat protein